MLDNGWLADQLTANGLLTRAQIEACTSSGSGDLCQDLITNQLVQEQELLRFLGLLFQTRYVSTDKLSTANIVQWVLDLLPIEFCESHQVLPVRCEKEHGVLSVVTSDPADQPILEEIKSLAAVQEVHAYIALPHAIEAGIRRFYRGDLHAFARMDSSLRQTYSELLSIYEQRLIDFEADRDPITSTEPAPPAASPAAQVAVEHVDLEPAAVSGPSVAMPGRVPCADPSAELLPPGVGNAVPAHDVVRILAALVTEGERGKGWRENHSVEVARLTGRLAALAGVQGEDLFDLQAAALLHEFGKPLDPHLTVLSIAAQPALHAFAEECSERPWALLRAANLSRGVERVLRSLYERVDGKGVPGKQAGAAIPLGARLLAIADAYCDALANPGAAGGQCHSAEAAMERLRDAANKGWLDASAVEHLDSARGATQPVGGLPLVLIIDEDAHSAAVLEAKLKSAGFDVIVAATTGDAALALLGEKVGLVLCEVDLRPMDGFTFLQWLRTNKRTSEIPFMFLSGRASVDDVNRGFELGAVDYIVKPYRPEVVLAKIKRAVKPA